MTTTRLSPDRWIDAGFDALVAQGSSALKAEALARNLKTTKGSFYWHFKDVPAFHNAMLARWEHNSKAHFEAPQDAQSTPTQRLRHFAQAFEKADHSDVRKTIEPAIRAWAHGNPKVSQAVTRVDNQRMGELTKLLKDIGLSNPELSRIIYAANLGMSELSGRDGQENTEALGTLVDLVLALYS